MTRSPDDLAADVRAVFAFAPHTSRARRKAVAALDDLLSLAARAEAAEAALAERDERLHRIHMFINGIGLAPILRSAETEAALADMRRALGEVGGTLPDPMHPAFPPEFVDKQAAALAIIDRALAASEGTAPGEPCEACRGTGQWMHHGGVSQCFSCGGSGLVAGTAPSEGEA